MNHRYPPLRERLFSRLTPCPDEGCECLLWPGAKNNGYGMISEGGGRGARSVRVHRAAYELLVGPIPDGLQIDHVKARGCRHRNCANVAHLEPVTCRENLLRGDTFQARNAAKTHCPQGHPYDEVNTYRRAGQRFCRACARSRWDNPDAVPMAERTHCPQGHPYDEVNTYRAPDGRRHCRICAQSHRQAHRDRRRLAA